MSKTRIAKTNSFSIELYEEFKKVSENTRIPMSRLLDEALEYLIKKYSKGVR